MSNDAYSVKQARARGVNDFWAAAFIWKNITAADSLSMREAVPRPP